MGDFRSREKQQALLELKKKCLECQSCEIGQSLIEVDGKKLSPHVFARGNVSAKIILVGQNPGKTEIIQGKPFVGDAGKFLDKMLSTIELDEKYIYVSNAVKCFTPKNRPPTDREADTCKKFINEELKILQPKLIITLGNSAMKTILGYAGITKHRGESIKTANYEVFPLLHPACTLHNRTKYLPMIEEDLSKLKEIIKPFIS